MTSSIIPLPSVLLSLESVERKGKIQEFEYLENEKSFLVEIKNIFHSFSRAIIWRKNKNLIKKQRTQAISKEFQKIDTRVSKNRI